MRYYRGCLIDRNCEFTDARGHTFTWGAWSVEWDYPVVCAMSLGKLHSLIDQLLALGTQVKCALCDDHGMIEGIGGREVECSCGLAPYLAEIGVADGPSG